MTKKEFQKILNDALPVSRGFAVRGGLAFIKPVESVLRGICCERSIDPDSFYVWVFVQPMYVPSDHIFFNFGWRVGEVWMRGDPELIPRLKKSICERAMPFLEFANEPKHLPMAAEKWNQIHDPVVMQIVGYSYAKIGDVEKACEVLERFVHRAKETGYGLSRVQDVERFLDLLKSDFQAAQCMLVSWERETRAKLRLEC